MVRILLILIVLFKFSFAESVNLPPLQDLGPFIGLEATVGYIQKENGEKFMVIETPEGTKLVKVKTNPQEIINKKINNGEMP